MKHKSRITPIEVAVMVGLVAVVIVAGYVTLTREHSVPEKPQVLSLQEELNPLGPKGLGHCWLISSKNKEKFFERVSESKKTHTLKVIAAKKLHASDVQRLSVEDTETGAQAETLIDLHDEGEARAGDLLDVFEGVETLASKRRPVRIYVIR